MSESKQARRVTVVLSKQDYERLSNLSKGAYRSISGYMRWLLQQHIEELDSNSPHDGKSKRQDLS